MIKIPKSVALRPVKFDRGHSCRKVPGGCGGNLRADFFFFENSPKIRYRGRYEIRPNRTRNCETDGGICYDDKNYNRRRTSANLPISKTAADPRVLNVFFLLNIIIIIIVVAED